jgi:hypothetical protein
LLIAHTLAVTLRREADELASSRISSQQGIRMSLGSSLSRGFGLPQHSSAATPGVFVPFWLAAALGVAFSILSAQIIMLPAFILLWWAWKVLATEEGPPVLPLAFTHYWLMFVIGYVYFAPLGRLPLTSGDNDASWVVTLAVIGAFFHVRGISWGLMLAKPPDPTYRTRKKYFFTEQMAITLYAAFLVGSQLLGELSQTIEGLRQVVLAMGSCRLVFLYLLLRRYVAAGRWSAFATFAAIDVLFGFTGFFAGFREAFAIMFLALLERFDRRKTAHWGILIATMACTMAAGTIWLSIRSKLRAEVSIGQSEGRFERLSRVFELSSEAFANPWEDMLTNADKLADRMWSVHWWNLTLRRVPAVLPHTDGEFIQGAVSHILQPRLLFPDKQDLMFDSDKVRKYSGVWVAGVESGTSIAFGYMPEAYVDFGVPMMYLPIFLFGLFIGVAYRYVNRIIYHRELAVATNTVVMWSMTYNPERSWDRMLGLGVTALAAITLFLYIVERFSGDVPAKAD